jgi:prevent-host-death family protein
MCTQLGHLTTNLPAMARTSLGTRELRANLATALRRAAAGERVIVTDSGRPVAQLGPVDAPAGSTIEELVSRGLVVPPRRAPRERAGALPTPIDIHSGMRFDQIVRDLR